MKKFISVLMVVLLFSTLSGCQLTAKNIEKDIETSGEAASGEGSKASNALYKQLEIPEEVVETPLTEQGNHAYSVHAGVLIPDEAVPGIFKERKVTVDIDYINRMADKHQLQCTCGHSGCLTIHGYYTRSLKKDDSGISLSICRVRCSHCGRTHALLPSLLVPYSQVSLQDQSSIISAYEASGAYEEIMAGTPSIDENLIASIIKRYVKHWMQKIRSFRIELSFPPVS